MPISLSSQFSLERRSLGFQVRDAGLFCFVGRTLFLEGPLKFVERAMLTGEFCLQIEDGLALFGFGRQTLTPDGIEFRLPIAEGLAQAVRRLEQVCDGHL